MGGYSGRAAARMGKSFYHSNNSVAVQTIIAPAANQNGVILRLASMGVSNGTAALYADTAAPVSVVDATKRTVRRVTKSADWDHAHLRELYLPPATGLYYVSNAANNTISVTWDVLP